MSRETFWDHEPSIEQLSAQLLEQPYWDAEQRVQIAAGIEVARTIHQNQTYNGQPYIHHPLSVASGVVDELGIHDADIVVAALLHDGVEDQAEAICTLFSSELPPKNLDTLQRVALWHIAVNFSPAISGLVKGLTNAPDLYQARLSHAQNLQRYADKVASAIEAPKVCPIKFMDNDRNIVAALENAEAHGYDQTLHFIHKYRQLPPIYKARLARPDMQELLSPQALDHMQARLSWWREHLVESVIN